MAEVKPRGQFKLRPGPYLGEISALSFFPVSAHLSPFPLLLAGTGSELLLYDVGSGDLIKSQHIFQGIRVHGITVRDSSSVAVFAERRVKLFRLRVETLSCVDVVLDQEIPRFDHWVLDLCFLKEEDWLAVGLTDNSVALWNIKKNELVARVRYPERCLLYSMRMWGDGVDNLLVASGTIFNEIVIWRLCRQGMDPSQTLLLDGNYDPSISSPEDAKFPDQQMFIAVHVFRLTGHEGSIFRMAWSSDGSTLMSVSDDRSAKIWMINAATEDDADKEENHHCQTSVYLTLFGHNARIWDCYLSDSIAITAGEDCTCRVWGMDGRQLLVNREHVGRGIWRCLYDPSSSLLVTAGFDSVIKVHLFSSPPFEGPSKHVDMIKPRDHTENFSICAPKAPKQLGLMNSKSEYVRCLCFTQEDILYVATNNGYLYHVKLFNPGDVQWTELTQVSQEVPIICMDIIALDSYELSANKVATIAVGDGQGNATICRVITDGPSPNIVSCFTWSAEKPRQLLGIFWCKSLGCSHVFTTNPGGVVKLWKLNDVLKSESGKINSDQAVSLITVFTSCYGARVTCLDASNEEKVLVCGDQRGNLTVFHLPKGLMVTNFNKMEETPLVNQFKGAHGISTVTSILIARTESKQVHIRTTGADGCICCFKYDTNMGILEFIGMKQVNELSSIQFVVTKTTLLEDFAHAKCAIGFTSADFIMWDLRNEAKIIQIPCGGWRRPYSYYIGAVPEYQNCFAFLKDQIIHIHRRWAPVHAKQLFPLVLHMQYHGREIHSLTFISSGFPRMNRNYWIATGCEDGTVRLTRYLPFGIRNWSASELLGEHVGGSAVRSICFVSRIYKFNASLSCNSFGGYIDSSSADSHENQFLLISVGAKQVLTSWRLLQNRQADKEEAHVVVSCIDPGNKSSSYRNEMSSLSFQWLSSYMPSRFSSTHRKAGASNQKPKDVILDDVDNDWRYMAVTGFLVKHADSRLATCFIVVACSDATLSLRALLLPYRLWFEVAVLVPQKSPVLALQHVSIPIHASDQDNEQIGNVHIIISGSTDGSITFWDVTGTVECFMHLVIKLQPELLVGYQKRPQTGRGSQGGRWWRSLTTDYCEKKVQNGLDNVEVGNSINGLDKQFETLSVQGDNCTQTGPKSSCSTTNDIHKTSTINLPCEVREVRPLYVLHSVHQSGVNCLHVSEMKDFSLLKSGVAFCVVSGGDDQALHCLGFDLTLQMESKDCNPCLPSDLSNPVRALPLSHSAGDSITLKRELRVLSQDKIVSAHSSAVKGIWTDGNWAFSTGLDQRIRCWKIDPYGKLTEYSCLIISVPEPEALAAVESGSARNGYQIGVAGRGMQMVEFCCSSDED